MSEAVVDTVRHEEAATGGRRILVSAMRNEGPFILEWIAYHRAIGFDTIIIASNDCTDGSDALLDALADAGEITHVRHSPPPRVSAQANAARRINAQAPFSHGDWVMWLDADEFLNIKAGEGHLDDLLGVIGPRKAMLVNWRFFGDGGQDGIPERFISSAFDRGAAWRFWKNCNVKTIWRVGPEMKRLAPSGIHRPLVEPDADLKGEDVLNGSGSPIALHDERHGRWLRGEDFPHNAFITRSDYSWSVAQINHYAVRTRSLFELKKKRGRGWRAGREGERNDRHNDAFFREYNRNDRVDRSILRWSERTGEEIARLHALPGVAKAQQRTLELTGEQIAANPAPPPSDIFVPELTLPEDEAAHVRVAYAEADCILEYGSGGSTMLAVEQGTRKLMSVESDPKWADDMRRSIAAQRPTGEVHLVHADIGPTGDWGRPRDASARERFHLYPLGIWDEPFFEQPDLVLIDGRFRIACFAAVMLRTERPVTVLFDDYTNRRHYHVVERFFRPVRTIGRMAEFNVTPNRLQPKDMTDVIGWFQKVE